MLHSFVVQSIAISLPLLPVYITILGCSLMELTPTTHYITINCCDENKDGNFYL